MKKLILSILLLSAIGCTSFDGKVLPAPQYELKDKFAVSSYEASNGIVLPIRVYYPEIVQPRLFPVIVYLHGAGQNGTDNEQQLDDGVGCLYSFSAEREDYKAVIVAPQCPAGAYWRNDDMLKALAEMIEHFASNKLVDKSKVFVTGFSMGGDATWKLGLRYPSIMSTLVPVCGGPLESMEPDIPDVPNEMAKLNVWAFNNFDDGVVRPRYSKRIFAKLWSIDVSDKLNFTENISGGHNASKVYSNRDLLIWMLSTSKKQ